MVSQALYRIAAESCFESGDDVAIGASIGRVANILVRLLSPNAVRPNGNASSDPMTREFDQS